MKAPRMLPPAPHSQALRGRRGAVFPIRLTDEEKARALALQEQIGGPASLGSWLRWRALLPSDRGGITPTCDRGPVLPIRAGITGAQVLPSAQPNNGGGITLAGAEVLPARAERTILDLCAGSGSWSAPYERAGYRVIRVTLPDHDVRQYVPPESVWGVLAAPPCTEFSLARNMASKPRDVIEGMACVNACMRIVLQCRPQWWALENPAGYLSQILGTPRDVFEPWEYGDPWTKRTALWGSFNIPQRGPHVAPERSWVATNGTPAARAITPPGFASAFCEANP